jgi:protein arginine kinase activator
MLCEMCRVNNASVHIVKVINGIKQELNICDKCAKSTEGLGFIGDSKLDAPFTFQNILSGLMEYANQSSHSIKNTEAKCPRCGISYGEFKQKGLMGCEDCYKFFSSTLMPVIKRVQGNVEHIGKIPLKAGKDIMEKKRLRNLKEELQKAVLAEEYEKAAELRDLIRQLQNNQ